MGRSLKQWRENPELLSAFDAAIREHYPAHGPKPIMDTFGVTEGSVSSRAFRIGVKTDLAIRQARRIATKRRLNTSVNHAYFDTWSPNMAWLLGYTWTDGAVYNNGRVFKVAYRCKQEDGHIIHDIKAELQSQHKIQRLDTVPTVFPSRGRGYNTQPQVGISINSEGIVRSLTETHGILQNKSNLDLPMPYIPGHVFPHFVRGVLDGDGSVLQAKNGRNAQVILYGSHRFILELQQAIMSCMDLTVHPVYKHGQSKTLSICRWGAGPDVIRLLEWLYPTDTGLAIRRKFLTSRSILLSGLMTGTRRTRHRICGTFYPQTHRHLIP